MAYTQEYVHSGNAPERSLASGISSGTTTITLDSTSGWPSPTGAQKSWGTLAPDTSAEEHFTYTGISGNDLTGVTREQDGTTAVSHDAGVKVRHGWSKTEADEAGYVVRETVGKITDANQLLVSDASQSLDALTVAASRIVGRKASGDVAAMTVAETVTLLQSTELAEYIADTVGAMVTGNTETGITVTYQDSDNTLDFAVSGAAPELGYAEVTANQNTIGTTLTDLTGLTTSVTVASGVPVKVTVGFGFERSAAGVIQVAVLVDGVAQVTRNMYVPTTDPNYYESTIRLAPSAGSRTIKAQARALTSGTFDLTAAAGTQAFIHVANA